MLQLCSPFYKNIDFKILLFKRKNTNISENIFYTAIFLYYIIFFLFENVAYLVLPDACVVQNEEIKSTKRVNINFFVVEFFLFDDFCFPETIVIYSSVVISFAKQKLMILIIPSLPKRMFEGFRSRWMIPRLWTYFMPSATWYRQKPDSTLPRAFFCTAVSRFPAQNSSSMHGRRSASPMKMPICLLNVRVVQRAQQFALANKMAVISKF